MRKISSRKSLTGVNVHVQFTKIREHRRPVLTAVGGETWGRVYVVAHGEIILLARASIFKLTALHIFIFFILDRYNDTEIK